MFGLSHQILVEFLVLLQLGKKIYCVVKQSLDYKKAVFSKKHFHSNHLQNGRSRKALSNLIFFLFNIFQNNNKH